MLVDDTTVSLGSLIIVACLGFLLVVLPRQYALAPILIGACYLTLGQAIVVSGVHFHLIRVLIAFGLVRLLVRREISSIKLNAIDKVLIAWIIVRTFLYVLVSGDTESFLERLGALYNTVGIYFLVRAVVRSFDDIIFNVKMLGLTIIPLAVPFLVEYTTGRNPFFALGGVPEFTQIREGRLRCQGAFRHPILAGTFGATAIPLLVGLWRVQYRQPSYCARCYWGSHIHRVCFLIKRASSCVSCLPRWISLLDGQDSHQSHPMGHCDSAAGVARSNEGTSMVPYESFGRGRWRRGNYRSALIDASISHFDEWWLIGTEYTSHWMPTGVMSNPKMADIVNHYIAQGVSGGLLCLILFVWLLVQCFKATGKAILDEDRFSSSERFMIWALGCTVLGHAVSFSR